MAQISDQMKEELENKLIDGAKKLMGEDGYKVAYDMVPKLLEQAEVPMQRDTIKAFTEGLKAAEAINGNILKWIPTLREKLGDEDGAMMAKGMFLAILMDFERTFDKQP